MQNRGSIFFYIITVVIIIIEISVIIFQSLRLSEPSLNTYSEFKEIYTSSRYNYDDKTLRVIAKKNSDTNYIRVLLCYSNNEDEHNAFSHLLVDRFVSDLKETEIKVIWFEDHFSILINDNTTIDLTYIFYYNDFDYSILYL